MPRRSKKRPDHRPLVSLLGAALVAVVAWQSFAMLSTEQQALLIPAFSDEGTSEGHSAGLPVRFEIPSLNVDAPVEHVGLAPNGNMDVPKEWNNVGWFALGIRPGEPGNSVIAGHLDSPTAPAVFWDLKKLQPGDEVIVTDDRGQTWTFRVTKMETYVQDEAPLEEIFGKGKTARLNLITCEGTWDTGRGTYSKRLAVFTELVE